MLRFLCAAIAAALLILPHGVMALDGAKPSADWRTIASQQGGLIFVMRHTDKAAHGAVRSRHHPAGFDGATCMLERGLTVEGERRALAVGRDFADRSPEIGFASTASSTLCRTAHTAFLAANKIAPVTAYKIKNGAPYEEIDESEIKTAAQFRSDISKMAISAGASKKNVMVAIHSNWIEALFDEEADVRAKVGTSGAEPWPADQCYGEVRIYKPVGDSWVQIGRHTEHATYANGRECLKS